MNLLFHVLIILIAITVIVTVMISSSKKSEISELCDEIKGNNCVIDHSKVEEIVNLLENSDLNIIQT